MHYVFFAILFCSIITDSTIAKSDEPADSAATKVPTQADQPAGVPDGPDAWRYKRHHGLWWYWLPTEKWVYWNDGKWVPYDQKTYAEFQASQRATTQPRGDSSNRGNNWGQWGPIRYDGYGNRQYPYSMRSRGMQQLGPVPTPGGVRSLPGWGGER